MSVDYTEHAQNQEHRDARNKLGNCTGRGVGKDYAEAIKYYKMAAEQGHAGAQYSLGDCNYHGKGVIVDYATAVRYFKLAADQGLERAQDAWESVITLIKA
mgnify:CR=1 FL=1